MKAKPSVPVKIRPYRDSDYDAVKGILVEGDLFDKVWDRRSNLRRKKKYNARSVLVATHADKVVGNVYVSFDGWEGFVYRLAVAKEHRRHGVGSTLLREAERELKRLGAREVDMFVDSKNKELQNYYKKRGYNLSKTWRSMWKTL